MTKEANFKDLVQEAVNREDDLLFPEYKKKLTKYIELWNTQKTQ